MKKAHGKDKAITRLSRVPRWSIGGVVRWLRYRENGTFVTSVLSTPACNIRRRQEYENKHSNVRRFKMAGYPEYDDVE